SSSDLGKGARACVPLKADARVIGFLYVDGREKGGVFTDLDLEILEALADHAALLMGSVRPESPIRVLLGMDVVTVPAGHRSFLDDLERKVGDIIRASVRRSTETA
ncbi:MAG TPA: GAF domain-containing protein, partial [Thermoanaerobaculia bacterium]|nr:GAF domain-containing protein [Thermoanaerobaculia bacterium]